MALDKSQKRPRPRTKGIDDTPLAEPLYSPVCTFCKWWGAHADRWQYCSAYPHTAGKPIPQPVWDGTPGQVSGFYHTEPLGNEAKDKQGQPYLFEPVPGAKLPLKLRAAYETAKNKPPQN